ncbi:ABC transporter ATP-binding protein [Variovorax sp. RTB1]|uniref:ABC transporter ATP-binding protein n=1 Tax=Variovorax sp. RTB1 TaxID=3048631 RepID=UPI002B23CFC2|nr:ABC transporter ATP-binding protein [Variovorax sp. RTB1]MEB0113139.1 ABC transporter ATP-binding protein [Variovorax sp. RTB1]
MAEPVVRLHDVHKVFNAGLPNECEVLHGIDLTVSKGEFCAVVGPSGSGKSTLLNIVGLLDRPTSGSLSISGAETSTLDEHALTQLRGHNIGFVFQNHNLLSGLTAMENVMMPMLGAAGFFNEGMAQRAAALLESVDLTKWRDSMVTQLSGGQQQRVALARSLTMDTALLLADEPTGNLDTKSADVVFDLLRKANQEHRMAILFVTHNPGLAERCDRTIQVVDGRLEV